MLLSVCIPTWNRCSFIRLSARYWLEQMGPFVGRMELIIADNASDDDTVAVLKSYGEPGSFRLIERARNLGFNGSTYDLVTEQAQGEFVWVCGDDDYLNPGALAEVISALEGNREHDHFYITTQFVPKDHAPDLAREDPRESPYMHRPLGDASNQVVRAREILELDAGGFGGFYSSIWRKTLAIEALSGDFRSREPFTSLEATLPYAVFVARQRLQEPCYRIGRPILTVVHTISWPHYASLFRLKMMPELYDLYREKGVPRAVLSKYQVELLDHWPRAFVDLIRRRRSDFPEGFSFPGFLRRHFFEAAFWKELFRYLWCDLLP